MLAHRIEQAWINGQPIQPISATDGIVSPELAYPVQRAWADLRRAAGDRAVGRKLGLTNRVIQEMFGTTTPDHGLLWASRQFSAHDGGAVIPASTFIQPQIEGEIAFQIGRRLAGPGVTVADVIDATAALAPALEVIDSRFVGWQGTLGDTIADNASYGGFVTGAWTNDLLMQDLRTVGMVVDRNGEIAIEGIGAGSLGHPAAAVAWLVNELATRGEALEAGEIVLSGALGRPVPVAAGDMFVLWLHGCTPLTARFG